MPTEVTPEKPKIMLWAVLPKELQAALELAPGLHLLREMVRKIVMPAYIEPPWIMPGPIELLTLLKSTEAVRRDFLGAPPIIPSAQRPLGRDTTNTFPLEFEVSVNRSGRGTWSRNDLELCRIDIDLAEFRGMTEREIMEHLGEVMDDPAHEWDAYAYDTVYGDEDSESGDTDNSEYDGWEIHNRERTRANLIQAIRNYEITHPLNEEEE